MLVGERKLLESKGNGEEEGPKKEELDIEGKW